MFPALMAGLGSFLSGGGATGAGALLGGLGSIMGGRSSADGQAKANIQNQIMAQRQMNFQERMARHAHRYEVRDLRKAGLNPILSGTGGAGSATPAGSTARMENVEGAGVSSAMQVLSTISQALLASQEAKKTDAETTKTVAQTETEKTQPTLNRATTELVREQTNSAKATQANLDADTRLKEMGQKVQMAEIDNKNELTDLFKKQGLTQDMQSKLLSVNAEQGLEILKGLRNTGAINESQFGQTLQLIDRFLDTVNKIPVLGSKR